MTDQNARSSLWPGGVDVLVFCGGVIVFLYVGLMVLGVLSDLLAISRVREEQTLFRYGGTAVLVWLLIIGSISFFIGVLVARRLRRVRTRWLSALVGGLYSFGMVAFSMFVPLQRGSISGVALTVFLLLFPAVGLVVGALTLNRSNLPLQPDRPQAGGG